MGNFGTFRAHGSNGRSPAAPHPQFTLIQNFVISSPFINRSFFSGAFPKVVLLNDPIAKIVLLELMNDCFWGLFRQRLQLDSSLTC